MYTGCGSLVVVLSLIGIREVVSSSPARAGRVKPKYAVIAHLPRAQHLEVRITGLLDMTLKTEVACRSRCGT
jgi:hypothetical protein